MKTMITALTIIASLAFYFANTAHAAPQNLDIKGVAIQGYDPVAYFTQGKATKGSSEFSASHQGATYQFANATHQSSFKNNPNKYTPQYGGYCAYGVSVGKLIKVDPKVFTIHKGRLLLQVNRKHAKISSSDLNNNVVLADQKWVDLSKK